MKLRFAIQYGTQWGENLYVAITFRSKDATEKVRRLPMTTDDGWHWELETSAVESRQHPVETITYYYYVADPDGLELRREWTGVPRTYYFDATKNYILPDLWRDVPLQYHLYSRACQVTSGMPSDETLQVHRLPLYRKTIIFRVSAPQLRRGQSVAILGSHPALGSWNTARYLRMEPIGLCDWQLSVNVDAVLLPLEYKFVIVDDATHALVAWEEGDNRSIEGMLPPEQTAVSDGTVLVVYGESLRIKEDIWRASGVAVPVFSLRSSHSCGVGDFGDLRLLVDWAKATGMKVIQLLPVNDTTSSGTWSDSYPYNIVSAFALHPQYLDLNALGPLRDKKRMTAFLRQRGELNALGYTDYVAVQRVKSDYVRALFEERGQQTLDTKEFKAWFTENSDWLKPYAEWLAGKSTVNCKPSTVNCKPSTVNCQPSTVNITYFTQYHLHLQLKAAADYARENGVVLKGDVPIGVNRDSVETALHPELFCLDASTGAPPDSFSQNGQNWGFPTYNWEASSTSLFPLSTWFRKRLRWMEQYFDAIRIDHVLGFFRIWEIPEEAVFGLLGHFSPALPMTQGEIEYFGLPFRKELFTRPFINDRVLQRIFGLHVPYVKEIVLGAFSAWRAGCVYLPFDDAYPEERLNYMLENSGAVAIMTVREFWRQKPLEFPERKVIYLDDLTAAVVATDPEPSLTEDAPAMLLYTSGTTGRPKGVLHTHGLLANLLEWMDPREAPEVNENSRGGIATGFTFVGSQVFMFGTLARGGTVCIAPEAARRELDCLNRFIHEICRPAWGPCWRRTMISAASVPWSEVKSCAPSKDSFRKTPCCSVTDAQKRHR